MTLSQRTFGDVELERARRTDPQTSKTAAAMSHELAAEHIRKILQVVRTGGDWTAHEIAEKCGLDSTQVTRRFAQLRREGEIVDVKVDGLEVTRPSPKGRPMQVVQQANGAHP